VHPEGTFEGEKRLSTLSLAKPRQNAEAVLKTCELLVHGVVQYTGLFISPSGISELDCATTKTETAERSISIDR